MKAPFFWYRPPSLLSTFLSPLGWLYDQGGRVLSSLKKTHRFAVPIISLGNVVSGGSGKTPTAIALAQLFTGRGIAVHFVTRGYGGKQKGPLMVDFLVHTAQDVGDESLLLARHAPTWVAKNRAEGIQEAVNNGAQLILLDDGHQTKGIHKDISFVVIDHLQGFGNECVIPAGPLRENLERGLKRADGFICVGSTIPSPLVGEGGPQGRVRGIHFQAHLVAHPLNIPTKGVIAFCGLGFPQKFYRSLEGAELELLETKSFPDHYHYTEEDLLTLQNLAQEQSCVLITTRKDWVKLPPSWQKKIYTLDISIEFEDPEAICDFILRKINC